MSLLCLGSTPAFWLHPHRSVRNKTNSTSLNIQFYHLKVSPGSLLPNFHNAELEPRNMQGINQTTALTVYNSVSLIEMIKEFIQLRARRAAVWGPFLPSLCKFTSYTKQKYCVFWLKPYWINRFILIPPRDHLPAVCGAGYPGSKSKTYIGSMSAKHFPFSTGNCYLLFDEALEVTCKQPMYRDFYF